MLSPYARRHWLIIAVAGALLTGACLGLRWWVPAALVALVTLAGLAFFRDPKRDVPTRRGAVVSPADGRVRSVHRLDHYEPLDGPAHCIRIFLSVFDVHVQRAPLHGRVIAVDRQAGAHANALRPDSADVNASVTLVLQHPARDQPLAAVRQIVGTIARRIICTPAVGDIIQRGQRYGIIVFGSTVELYLPEALVASIDVEPGRYIRGGASVIAQLRKTEPGAAPQTEPSAPLSKAPPDA